MVPVVLMKKSKCKALQAIFTKRKNRTTLKDENIHRILLSDLAHIGQVHRSKY